MTKGNAKKLLLLIGLLVVTDAVLATTGKEFKDSAEKFSGMLGGEYGRAAALGGTGLGLISAMVTKSFMPVLWGVGAAIGVPVILGIINGSFAAVIV